MEIKKLIEELRNEIKTCQMDIAGGNGLNINSALETLGEIEKATTRVFTEKDMDFAYDKGIIDCLEKNP